MADDPPSAPPPSYDEAIKSQEGGQPPYIAPAGSSNYGQQPPYPYPPYYPGPGDGYPPPAGAYPVGSGPMSAPYPPGGPVYPPQVGGQYGNISTGVYNTQGPHYVHGMVSLSSNQMMTNSAAIAERKKRIMCMVLFVFVIVIGMVVITNIIVA